MHSECVALDAADDDSEGEGEGGGCTLGGGPYSLTAADCQHLLATLRDVVAFLARRELSGYGVLVHRVLGVLPRVLGVLHRPMARREVLGCGVPVHWRHCPCPYLYPP